MSERPPAEQWWTINGAELMAALQRAYNGDLPDVVYLELLANSDGGTDYGELHSLDDVAAEFGVNLDETPLRALASDWQANGNSRELGDPTASAWHEAARQLLAVLDGREPTGW